MRIPQLVATLAAISVLTALALEPEPDAGAQLPAKPNFVLILTDDQTLADLYERRGGTRLRVMQSTLRLLRDRGVSFRRAYASNPISCPSRSTLLTGQYSSNHHVRANILPGGEFCSDSDRLDLERTLPVWLQASGYRTLHFGRFLNGWGHSNPYEVPPGWDRWVAPVDTPSSPAALFYGYHLNEDGVLSPMYGEVGRSDSASYFTDVITDKAIAALEQLDPAEPFFLQLDHRAPHEDLIAPVGPEPALRHVRALRRQPPPRPPSFNEGDTSDKAPFLRRSERMGPKQIRLIEYRNRRRLQSLLAVDESVSRVFAALAQLGELERTYIVFASDHGFFRGEHRFVKGKRRPYEPATRIPLLIRGPGIPAGRTSGELVANIDIAPTLVELAGAIPTLAMDGRSLLGYAIRPGARSGRPILLEGYFGRFGAGVYAPVQPGRAGARVARQPTPKTWKAIVLGRWKLIRYSKGVYELYDLRRDPHELRSLARRGRFAPVRRFLARGLARLAYCRGRSCRAAMPKPPKPRRIRRRP
jgi:N-acetylglucosamine-6-sulfatase